ncbi:MAG: protein tyrosine phosphatase family protein [Porticoccaceae bacterium]|nr:protein tyrosine phosphatase family protein [Porticoccaceae bacterium]
MKAVAMAMFLTVSLSNLSASNLYAQDKAPARSNLEQANTPAAQSHQETPGSLNTLTPLIAIPNAKAPFPNSPSANILVGGQPSVENIRAAHRAGYKTIINLRPKGEFKVWDEAALAEQLGINYILIPIDGKADITSENALRLDQALQARAHSPTIVHCASGNRVGALFALRAQLQGSDPEAAMAIGRAAGLTSLAPLLKKLLQP